ncbi:LytTR family transcriptional regulator DNA-binding domain-containing protein [Natronoflexus pectinivorans]|uniref:LytTr DNA-binding domain-containing protein n=1 Tax=Natronoflexus pectinivorans TaxID=682526 RepID=A0A4R2GDZ6_9BACT|nr:LytTR family transcriptional regulator DNA-binding domain-containing protein [Natronoflexus pectinivorans]TCO06130.1 LytTr DNA-binding domain-containing protein [Natronoflexus pectinivorans]
MNSRFQNIVNIKFPPNYFFLRPGAGSLIIGVITYLFVLIYRPLGTKASMHFGFEITMAFYCLAVVLFVYLSIILLRLIPFFNDLARWTLLKEVSGIFLILFFSGVGVYFTGFLIEDASVNRWNFSTFSDSVIRTLVVGMVPFGILSLRNFQLLLPGQRVVLGATPHSVSSQEDEIEIHSSLKKEHLNFPLPNFLFAESEGNYVAFHILSDNRIVKKVIRNSINNIQWQLEKYPNLFRSHRGFIVNLNRIRKHQGNSSGYRLFLDGTDVVVPVSRQNAEKFESLMALKSQS